MKTFKKTLIALFVVLIILQFIRPEKNMAQGDYVSTFVSETQPTPEVKTILKTACFDCHSNNTVYPWYAEIAPVSYWLADHIDEGKEHLNFSDWVNYVPKKKAHKLEELVEEVEKGEMPLESYTFIHQNARLTAEQTVALISWAKGARSAYPASVENRGEEEEH
ncbi:MAG: cytochrome C [Flavobacteriales bacterium CG_4_9_14_3_um_filter_40_17]|nr:MAG: cytochrome C [Flavobacteriales bacterium CG_4_9_14_3_um_filter_40_17]